MRLLVPPARLLIDADGGLRQETLFPAAFYWFGMITNTLARFAWIVFLTPLDAELAPFVEAMIVRIAGRCP